MLTTEDTDITNLSTQALVDMYGKCKQDLTQYKRRYASIEKELLSRKDIPGPSLSSEMNGTRYVVPQTLRYYRAHTKKGTVEKIASFLCSYVDQLRQTKWDVTSIRNLSHGIGNYLWTQRVVRERARIVFTSRKKAKKNT